MRKYTSFGIIAALWVALALVVWTTLVPGVLSPTAFGWINGAGVVFALVVLWIVRGAAPQRSLAGMLYDTEHERKRT